MKTQTRYTKAAAAFAAAFETRERPDGETFTTLADGAPEWMRDAVRDAHSNAAILPCDYFYNQSRAAADHAAETLADADADADAAETLADAAGAFADSAVPDYNAERTAWLADHLLNGVAVDEAAENGLVADGAGIFDRIGAGMAAQASETYNVITSAIIENADEYPAYVAGWNGAGYMPETEPAAFATFADAVEYLADELRDAADAAHVEALADEATQETSDAATRKAAALDEAAGVVDGAKNAPFSVTVDGVEYWIHDAE